MAQRTPGTTSRKSRLRRWGLGCAGVLLLGAVLLGLTFFYLSWLWHSPPAGWRESQQATAKMTPEQRRKAATSAENKVTAELAAAQASSSSSSSSTRGHRPVSADRVPDVSANTAEKADRDAADRPRPHTDQHTLTLTTKQINAWLEQRLPLWASNQNLAIPSQLSNFRYWVEQGKPVLACHVHTKHVDQVVSVMLDPRITKKGKMKLTIASVRAGRLTLPTHRLVDLLTSRLHKKWPKDKAAAKVAAVLKGKAFEPALPTRDGREAKLVAIDAQPRQTTLTFRTVPAGS